jgi:hypothetical protein
MHSFPLCVERQAKRTAAFRSCPEIVIFPAERDLALPPLFYPCTPRSLNSDVEEENVMLAIRPLLCLVKK